MAAPEAEVSPDTLVIIGPESPSAHTHTLTHTRAAKDTHVHTDTRAPTHAPTETHTHAHTRTRGGTHAHTHTHAQAVDSGTDGRFSHSFSSKTRAGSAAAAASSASSSATSTPSSAGKAASRAGSAGVRAGLPPPTVITQPFGNTPALTHARGRVAHTPSGVSASTDVLTPRFATTSRVETPSSADRGVRSAVKSTSPVTLDVSPRFVRPRAYIQSSKHVSGDTYDADSEDERFVETLNGRSTTTLPASSARRGARAAEATPAAAAAGTHVTLADLEHAFELLEHASYVRKVRDDTAKADIALRQERARALAGVVRVLREYAHLRTRQDGAPVEVNAEFLDAVGAERIDPRAAESRGRATPPEGVRTTGRAGPRSTPSPAESTRGSGTPLRSPLERRGHLTLGSPRATAAAADHTSDCHLPRDDAVQLLCRSWKCGASSAGPPSASASTGTTSPGLAARVYEYWLRKRAQEHGMPLLRAFHILGSGDIAPDLDLATLVNIIGEQELMRIPAATTSSANGADLDGAETDASNVAAGAVAARALTARGKLRDIDSNGRALARLRALRAHMEHVRILVDLCRKREKLKRDRWRVVGSALQASLLQAEQSATRKHRRSARSADASVAGSAPRLPVDAVRQLRGGPARTGKEAAARRAAAHCVLDQVVRPRRAPSVDSAVATPGKRGRSAPPAASQNSKLASVGAVRSDERSGGATASTSPVGGGANPCVVM